MVDAFKERPKHYTPQLDHFAKFNQTTMSFTPKPSQVPKKQEGEKVDICGW